MHYINEQITKTFEHLLNLYYKYHSISLPRKYRINQKKLDKYHSQNNSKYNIEEKNVIPRIKHLSDRKSISTQTTFNKKIDLIHPSPNTLSIISKGRQEINY
jgi:molybdenum cofactor biosynthesis enzyme MoaA